MYAIKNGLGSRWAWLGGAFAIFGGLAVQVPSTSNEPALAAALEAGGNDLSQIVVLADANHLFQSAVTGAVSEYGTLAPEFTPELLPLLVDWVADQTSVQG